MRDYYFEIKEIIMTFPMKGPWEQKDAERTRSMERVDMGNVSNNSDDVVNCSSSWSGLHNYRY